MNYMRDSGNDVYSEDKVDIDVYGSNIVAGQKMNNHKENNDATNEDDYNDEIQNIDCKNEIYQKNIYNTNNVNNINNANKKFDLVIVGGLGHVGLPLGITFAFKGLQVCLYDINKKNAELVSRGEMPFIEYGAEEKLKKIINVNLHISTNPEVIADSKTVMIALGTPIDEYLNPKTRQFLDGIFKLKPYLNRNQLIVLRSTVYPETCNRISKILGGGIWNIAYCPERIVQGYAIAELEQLSQIVSGITERAQLEAAKLFNIISPKIVFSTVKEAELSKLFSNAWRYIKFSVANQFYMISKRFDVDYNTLRNVMSEGYDRNNDLAGAGFAAGPCLLKDTMQLAAFHGGGFILGNAAMQINEGLPNFIVSELEKEFDLSTKKVGILGMAFKANVDDIRDSLSFKLGKILRFKGAETYYSDEFAKNNDFISAEELIQICDIIVVGVPHSNYKKMVVPNSKHVVDLWRVLGINARKNIDKNVDKNKDKNFEKDIKRNIKGNVGYNVEMNVKKIIEENEEKNTLM